MYEHHQLLEARLRLNADRPTRRLLAQDALVEVQPSPPIVDRWLAHVLRGAAAVIVDAWRWRPRRGVARATGTEPVAPTTQTSAPRVARS
jgi:hypothetical protein